MGVLDDVKVAEFAWITAGPQSTRSMAAHGAQVVRVESAALQTRRGFTDTPTAAAEGDPIGAYPNKLNLSVDLKNPRGMEVAKRLIAWADIMTESFSPGTIARMGLGYEEVKKIKPDIIMMSVSIQGQTGPYGKHPGYGVLASAITGLTQMTGWPDREPASPGAYSDSTTPRFGAASLLAALEYKRRTGRGQYIDLTQLESCLHLFATPLFRYIMNKEETIRSGNGSPYTAPHGVYRCQGEQRWCSITVFTEEQWESFCRVVNDPAITKNARFATLLGRKEHEAELDALVERWTEQRTPEEVMTLLQQAGVPAGIVSSVADLASDPQLQFRNHFQTLEDPVMGRSPFNRGESFILSETPGKLVRPSPTLGCDNERVCREFLGYSEAEYQALAAEGVF